MTTPVYKIDLHPDAEEDYANSYKWYESRENGLGEKFLQHVRSKLNAISVNPKTYSYKGKNTFREAIVDGFPFLVVYKVYEHNKTVFVSAIHHVKKDPQLKYRKPVA